MKYVVFDKKGLPKGFYDKKIHKNIPSSAIKITDNQWQNFINNQPFRAWDFENKKVIDISNSYWDKAQNKWVQKTEEQIKQEKLNNLQKSLIAQLKQIFKDYRLNKSTLQSQTINKEINARQQDLINIDGLIALLQNDTDTVDFRCADNTFIKVTKTQLQQMKDEIIKYGLQIYQNKWNIEKQINALTIDDADSSYDIDIIKGQLVKK